MTRSQIEIGGIEPRRCDWCRKELPQNGPPTQITCSQKCRQARHRFRVAPAGAEGDRPMSLAYFDPPYPGKAEKYYRHDPRCAEVDHAELIERACRDYPDGWALSTSAESIRDVLILCPPDVRTAIWVRGARRGDRENVQAKQVKNAWEPLIVWRGRPLAPTAPDVTDVLIWGGRQHTHPDALVGMKSAPFAEWMFRQLGAAAGDTLTDVFPGSGAVGRAWRRYNKVAARASIPSRLAGAQARVLVRIPVDDAADREAGDLPGLDPVDGVRRRHHDHETRALETTPRLPFPDVQED